MYIDLIVLIVLMIVVIMFFKRFSSFVFFIAIVDIFLRILNIGLSDLSALIDKYLPENIIDIIDKYSNSIPLLNTILRWSFIIIMIIFLSYIIKIFIHKKKI